jgi:type IV secretory pathway VirB10-like protein
MMKNNQMFQRLGLSTLASMINNTSSMSNDDVSQESGSLYDAQGSEGSEQEEVNKVHILLCITMFVL